MRNVGCALLIWKIFRFHMVYKWLYITLNNTSVIFVAAHRSATGLKKKVHLRSGYQRHIHFVRLFLKGAFQHQHRTISSVLYGTIRFVRSNVCLKPRQRQRSSILRHWSQNQYESPFNVAHGHMAGLFV